jgi:FkbM family methyltransferase
MDIFYHISLYLNLLKYFIKHKCEKNESGYILFLKDYFNEKKNGFYIDVGCYHPIRLSNTKFLYDNGWSGINIDISKKSIDLFRIIRKKDVNLNIGVGNKNEITDVYFQKELFHANTLDRDHAQKFLTKIIKEKINVLTLNSIIEKYAKNKKIDFIDIDCEGKDFEVLQGLNLSNNEIDLISIEIHGYDINTQQKSDLIFDIMKKNRFKNIYGQYPGTVIFKKF